MRQLWAPWRYAYIESALNEKESCECIFCHALEANQDDKYHILMRRDSCFAMLNKYPYNNGHLMIAPNKHVGDLYSLSGDELAELMILVRDTQTIISELMNPDGFNIGINIGRVAGAGIPGHIHIHIVPRWNGDTNFMPVIGDTKVMPQALEETYNKLVSKKYNIFKE